jgi:hypothetical protein
MPRPDDLLHSVLADQLTGADIGRRILVGVESAPQRRPTLFTGVLSDVETHRVGTRVAHIAVHPDGHLCTGATTAHSARIAVYVGGCELFLSPDHVVYIGN